ncbi:MAG: hypothetical protein OJF49_004015 [Ktedonobacterales bacterium]|jgi:hypothetical protein|nr:MAG: hypothetical protein OJF49_004015 [Ktedonobacterales bacterium]
MGGLLRRLSLAVLTGYIFVYFSEYTFWARPLDVARFPGFILVLVVYAFAAYVFLALVVTFHARTLAAIFLAGALFGWLDEGVFVQTMYSMLPLSISFTGLAWHALLTVLVGWFAVQRVVRARSWWRTAWVAAVIGTVYGAWAIWWWMAAPPAVSVASFARYVFVTTLVLTGVYWLASRPSLLRFAPTRVELIVVGLLILLYFAFITIPRQPLAVIILPPVVALALLTLRRNRHNEAGEDALAALRKAGPLRLRDVLPLLALPTVATAVYALAMTARVLVPTGWVVYILTTALGFIFFVYSLIAIWRAKPVANNTQPVVD